MNTRFLPTLFVGVLALTACTSTTTINSDTSSSAASTMETSSVMMDTSASSAMMASSAPMMSASVMIQSFQFSQKAITVKAGTIVTWTNNDSVSHTVTGDSSVGPASGPIAPGQTYSFRFDTVGGFPYHCAIHPMMTGTVTVIP